MTTSMVKGSPLKLMLQFAVPLLIGNLLQQTYNIIDAAIVGQFLGTEAVGALDASAKYLSCMGLFYWSLGILTVTRMVTQGLGYSGRTVFSGATEMVARAVVSLGFVGTFGYTAICFADQAAWIAACCYSVPTCLWCVKKSIAKLKQTK